jgi:hypothetical protein
MGVSVSDGRCPFEFEASDAYAGPGDARARSLEEERVATVTIPDTGRALLEGVPRSHRGLNQLLFEPLSRKDAQAVADLLAPVRDHMRSAPPRSAVVRRRRK